MPGTSRAGYRRARLVALADAHAPTLRRRSASWTSDTGFADYQEALADPRVDAVVVVTPTSLHQEIVLQAARRASTCCARSPWPWTCGSATR